MVARIVRYLLTISLIFMSYKETGAWTATCFFLISLAIELGSGEVTTRTIVVHRLKNKTAKE